MPQPREGLGWWQIDKLQLHNIWITPLYGWLNFLVKKEVPTFLPSGAGPSQLKMKKRTVRGTMPGKLEPASLAWNLFFEGCDLVFP